MTAIEKKIQYLQALQDVSDEIERVKHHYMEYDNDTDTWNAPIVNTDDCLSEYNYTRYEILNDIMIDLYSKAGITEDKKRK